MDGLSICKVCGKDVAKSAKSCPHCGAKLKKTNLKFIFGGLGILVVALIIISVIVASGPSPEDNINLVKNGYLGNHKTVSISKVLETNFKGCEIKWDNFETTDEKNIVEVFIKNPTLDKTLKIQFSLNKDDTFEVVHVSVDGEAFKTPDEASLFLDSLYEYYYEIASDDSIAADLGSDNSVSKNKDNKETVELLHYLRQSINLVIKDLGQPTNIDGVQASILYQYEDFYFIVDDNIVSGIGLTGSSATINGIAIGEYPIDVKSSHGKPTTESNDYGFIMDFRLDNDATSIQCYSDTAASPINLVTVTDLIVYPPEM